MLEMAIDGSSGIKKQDGAQVIAIVANNPLGQYMAFHFARDRWIELRQ